MAPTKLESKSQSADWPTKLCTNETPITSLNPSANAFYLAHLAQATRVSSLFLEKAVHVPAADFALALPPDICMACSFVSFVFAQMSLR